MVFNNDSQNGSFRQNSNFSRITDLTENITLQGYSRLKNISSSDFSKVFTALHTSTNNLVALKFFQSTFVKDPVKIQQYIKENVAAGRLNHINIAKVFEAGKLGELDYISMEFLYGRNLKSIMKDVKILNPYLASDIILRVALALEHANNNALIHKGVKLENIMILDQTKNVKLHGFGLAHSVSTDTSENGEILLDSLKYVSPEQAAEKAIDFRSDIYSLGVCYYYLVTGKYPFVSDNPEELFAMHNDAEFIAPSKIRFELSENIEKTIVKMLNKKPEDRFNSYSTLIANLMVILEIDDLQMYHEPAAAQEAIVMQPAADVIPLASAPISMNHQLVDVQDDEIEEIDINEIEEIDEIEIEEVTNAKNAPKLLKKPPKKLKSGKQNGTSLTTRTEIGREKQNKSTHLHQKGSKTRKNTVIDKDAKTGKHAVRRVKKEDGEAEKIKRKRKPENVEITPRKREQVVTSAKAKTPTSKKVKTPTRIQKVRDIKDTSQIQKAPPPLIPTTQTEKSKPIPVQNKQPQSADNDPDIIFPEFIQEHLPANNNSQSSNSILYQDSAEFLESRTSSGKYSKAPKVPLDGGDKIRINMGTLKLDTSSKLSNPDEKKHFHKNNNNTEEIDDIEIEEITDFTNIDLSTNFEDSEPDRS